VKNKFGIIYLVKNKINGKVYVGITTKPNGFNGRYSACGNGAERILNSYEKNIGYGEYYNEHLYAALKKYGIENFEVIEEFDTAYSKNELLEKERYWINYFKSDDYNYGYNCTNGGEGLDGGCQSFISKVKRKITLAEKFNFILNFHYNERIKWDNPFLYIWDIYDLTYDGQRLLWHKLKGGKTKFCKICGIEYYRSGKGDYCKSCGDLNFLSQYKQYKKQIKEFLIIK